MNWSCSCSNTIRSVETWSQSSCQTPAVLGDTFIITNYRTIYLIISEQTVITTTISTLSKSVQLCVNLQVKNIHPSLQYIKFIIKLPLKLHNCLITAWAEVKLFSSERWTDQTVKLWVWGENQICIDSFSDSDRLRIEQLRLQRPCSNPKSFSSHLLLNAAVLNYYNPSTAAETLVKEGHTDQWCSRTQM